MGPLWTLLYVRPSPSVIRAMNRVSNMLVPLEFRAGYVLPNTGVLISRSRAKQAHRSPKSQVSLTVCERERCVVSSSRLGKELGRRYAWRWLEMTGTEGCGLRAFDLLRGLG